MTQLDPLIFFFNGSFVRRDTGFHWRSFSLLRHLVDSGRRVIVYCYANHPIHPWAHDDEVQFAAHFPGVPLILETRPRAARLLSKVKKLASGVLPGLTGRIAAIGPAWLTPRLAALKREHPGAAVVASHATSLLDYNGVALDRCVVDTNDIHFVQVSKRFDWPIYGARTLVKFRSEMSLLAGVSGIVSLATPDAGLLRLCLGEKRVLFIPDFGTPVPLAANRASLPESARRLLFVGSDNPFNVEGIARFLREHRDLVTDRGIDIAGKVSLAPEVVDAALDLPAARLLGFVDDLSVLYADALAVVSPVDGTGIKIKVLEALANGVPVFGSDHTIQGLPPGHEGCVFPIDGAMLARLADPALLAQAGETALRWSATLTDNPDLRAFDALLLDLSSRKITPHG